MGRKSQEHMTGLSYPERVSRSRGPVRRMFRKIKQWIKPHENTHIANTNRSGVTLDKYGKSNQGDKLPKKESSM